MLLREIASYYHIKCCMYRHEKINQQTRILSFDNKTAVNIEVNIGL